MAEGIVLNTYDPGGDCDVGQADATKERIRPNACNWQTIDSIGDGQCTARVAGLADFIGSARPHPRAEKRADRTVVSGDGNCAVIGLVLVLGMAHDGQRQQH